MVRHYISSFNSLCTSLFLASDHCAARGLAIASVITVRTGNPFPVPGYIRLIFVQKLSYDITLHESFADLETLDSLTIDEIIE